MESQNYAPKSDDELSWRLCAMIKCLYLHLQMAAPLMKAKVHKFTILNRQRCSMVVLDYSLPPDEIFKFQKNDSVERI